VARPAGWLPPRASLRYGGRVTRDHVGVQTPRLAASLTALRAEVDMNYPGRSKASDGWIGDARHKASTSDHNPDPAGVVRALDITAWVAPSGVDIAGQLAEELRHARDPRIKYVIYDRRIFSATVQPWTWRPYTGSSPHTSHVHVSVMPAPAGDDGSPWFAAVPAPPEAPHYPLRSGEYYGPPERGHGAISRGMGLKRWQARMRARGWKINPDGIYGPQTRAVTIAFQREKRLEADALIGPATWAAAWTTPVTR
jgi:peptidoglycan hydrolase-like protein with peptidoglycan-binding domain